MPSNQPKDTRKRVRVAVTFSPEEMRQLKRKAGAKPVAEFCRERILYSDNFHDPFFDVCAKMNAQAEQMKALRVLLSRYHGEKWRMLLGGPEIMPVEVSPQFIEDVYEAIRIIDKGVKLGLEATRIISTRTINTRVIRPVVPGAPRR